MSIDVRRDKEYRGRANEPIRFSRGVEYRGQLIHQSYDADAQPREPEATVRKEVSNPFFRKTEIKKASKPRLINNKIVNFTWRLLLRFTYF